MKRTTISLPDELSAALAREARRQHTSVSHVAREAIEERLGRKKGRRDLPFIGLGASGYTTTAEDAEDILAAEWADAIDRDR